MLQNVVKLAVLCLEGPDVKKIELVVRFGVCVLRFCGVGFIGQLLWVDLDFRVCNESVSSCPFYVS